MARVGMNVNKLMAMLVFFAPVYGNALEYEATISAETEHFSNALLTAENERSELESTLGAALNLKQRTEDFSLALDYRARYLDFAHDTSSDQNLVDGGARLNWEIVEKRLSWSLENSRTDVIRDSRENDIRENREIRNIITTGPALRLDVTPVDAFFIEALYTDVSFEDSDQADSQRNSGNLRWQHRLSPISDFTVRGEHTKIDRDDDSSESKQSNISIAYKKQVPWGSYAILTGYTEIEVEGQKTDGLLARLNADYDSGPHRIKLVGLNEISDTSLGLGGSTLDGVALDGGDTDFNENDAVEITKLSVDYRYTGLCARCTVGVGAVASKKDFTNVDRDYETAGASFSFGYRVTRKITSTLSYQYTSLDYEGTGSRSDDQDNYGVNVKWSARRDLELNVWTRYRERDSSAVNQDFEDWSGGLSLEYKLSRK